MTKFDVMDMAMAAGISDSHFDFQMVSPDELLRFAALVADHEREACAKLAEQETRLARTSLSNILGDDAISHCHIAAAIRKRSNAELCGERSESERAPG